MEVCHIGRELGGFDEAPCPALEFAEGRFWCGFIRSPEAYFSKRAAEIAVAPLKYLLGIGRGCDSLFDPDGDLRATFENASPARETKPGIRKVTEGR